MDHVLVKVKGRGKKKLFKMLSDKTIFDKVEISDNACVEYNPDHNLDVDSWFKIDELSQQSYCLEFLKKEFDSKEYDDLTKYKFSKIAYICSVQDSDFYFQKITPSLFVSKKMIAFGEVAEVEECENRLVINYQPDAIYLKASNTLVFRNLASIASIFKGIDELYKEATKEEVGKFLEESFVELNNDYDIEKVSKPNRKRIALAMKTLSSMSTQDRDNIFSYIHSYCEEKLNCDPNTKTVEITTDEELKYLLYGIEQRFYTTPIGNERRLANSVQPL